MQAGMAYGQPYNQQAFTGVQVRPLHNNHIKKTADHCGQRMFYMDIEPLGWRHWGEPVLGAATARSTFSTGTMGCISTFLNSVHTVLRVYK